MDWQGQNVCEQLMMILLLGFSILGFVAGYSAGSCQMMLLGYAAGVVISTLISFPNWGFYNRHPLKWLDPIEFENPKPEILVSKKKITKFNRK
ncbi:hypothetical protein MKX01_032412 [Papaver californicum]|nr:hypothetical protein MKX01_032412 [Papaver californicum]